MAGSHLVGQWLGELGGAELRGGVIRVGNAEKGRAARQPLRARLDRDDVGGVSRVFVRRLEVDAADRVLDVQLALEIVSIPQDWL